MARASRGLACLAVAALAVSACSDPSANPVDWWHDLQGGPLAETRPPPPNADEPYPNLSTVPPKPGMPDLSQRDRLRNGLTADRANAEYSASQTPLTPLPPPAATPGTAGAPAPGSPPTASTQGQVAAPAGQASAKPAANDDELSSASLQAASAPPPPPPPKAAAAPPAPTSPAATPPATPPGSAAAAPGAAGASVAAGQPPAPPIGTPPTDIDATPLLPDMPAEPPPLPQLAGVDLPRSIAPNPFPVAPKPPPPPAAPPPPPGGPVTIAFAPGSAVLPTNAATSLKQLADHRGGAPIAVTGYGEATSSQADAQADALPLALARARAIALTLNNAGVPNSEIRFYADAQGDGGAARVDTR